MVYPAQVRLAGIHVANEFFVVSNQESVSSSGWLRLFQFAHRAHAADDIAAVASALTAQKQKKRFNQTETAL